VNKHD